MQVLSLTHILLYSKPSYVYDLAGIVGFKKAKKGHTTSYAAFCAKKLEAENAGEHLFPILESLHIIFFVGKPKGSMTTLPNFLTTNHESLSVEYRALSDDEKDTILEEHLAKAKDKLAKTKSNKSISKSVDSRVDLITSLVCFILLLL